MIISQLKYKNKHLVSLYLDGQFVYDIDIEVSDLYKLKRGREISNSELDEIKFRSDLDRAKNKAIYLLGYKDYTEKEMKKKLASYGFLDKAVDSALEYLIEIDLINDSKYAERYAERLFNNKFYSLKRIKYELKNKGIDSDIADDVLANYYTDQEEFRIQEILRKKYISMLTNEKSIKKVISALQRLGYNYSDIRKALSNLREEIL